MIEEAIYSRLSNDNDILYLVERTTWSEGVVALDTTYLSVFGVRIFPNFFTVFGTGAAVNLAFPAIVYRRVNTDLEKTLTGPSDLAKATVQVDCWGDEDGYEHTRRLADTVRRVLDGQVWVASGQRVVSCRLVDESDVSLKVLSESTAFSLVIRCEYEVWYYESLEP